MIPENAYMQSGPTRPGGRLCWLFWSDVGVAGA
jgi:hypothetical protein